MSSIFEELRDLKDSKNYSRDSLEILADKLENELGQAQMWNTLRPGFSTNELMENLIYIAKENDV